MWGNNQEIQREAKKKKQTHDFSFGSSLSLEPWNAWVSLNSDGQPDTQTRMGEKESSRLLSSFFFFFFNHLEHEMNDLLMNYTMRTYRCSFGPERSSCSLRPRRPTRSRETRSTSDTRSTLEGKKERDKV